MSEIREPSCSQIRSYHVFAVLLFAAFATRLLPLAISNYPYNNDALTECGIASEILQSGHLTFSPDSPWYGTHSVHTPIFDVMIAFVAGALGVSTFDCAQVVVACLAMTTIGATFLLGRLVSGSTLGGLVAGFGAIFLGTFVFTTGSAWKESLGFAMAALAFVFFVRRESMRFRVLLLVTLLLLPLVHHLVVAIVLLFVTYMVVWSWFFAAQSGSIERRQFLDAFTVIIPVFWTVFYYGTVELDRISMVAKPLYAALLICTLAVLCLIEIMVLSATRHVKISFAPIIGAVLITLVALDYFGFFFPYSPSVSWAYPVLIVSFGILLSIAWYGAELQIESRDRYRAILVGLLLSAATVVGFGIVGGLSITSQQIVYRTFDFVDIFIFVGMGAAIYFLHRERRRSYKVIAMLVIVCLVATFPFGYATMDLLGVRHDTQEYEVETLGWIDEHQDPDKVISDERIGYMGLALFGFGKDSNLPWLMFTNFTIGTDTCVSEQSWTTDGANSYPMGRIVVPESNYEWILSAGDVHYVGGPADDIICVFTGSSIGWTYLNG